MAAAGHEILGVPCLQWVGWEKGKEREMGKAEQSHYSYIIMFKMMHRSFCSLAPSGVSLGGGRGLVSHPVLPSSHRAEM